MDDQFGWYQIPYETLKDCKIEVRKIVSEYGHMLGWNEKEIEDVIADYCDNLALGLQHPMEQAAKAGKEIDPVPYLMHYMEEMREFLIKDAESKQNAPDVIARQKEILFRQLENVRKR